MLIPIQSKFIKPVVYATTLLGLSMNALAFSYTVKDGDTLSEIIYAHFTERVYGKNGNLRKVISYNPTILNPDIIYPGQIIQLDGADSQMVKESLRMLPALNLQNKEALEKLREEKNLQNSLSPSSSEPNDQRRKSRMPSASISFLADFSSSKIEAQDITNATKASLLSKSSSSFRLAYNQRWNNSFQSDLFFSQRKVSFHNPSIGGDLLNPEPKLYSFGAGLSFFSPAKNKFRFWLANESVPFLRGISPTEVSIDQHSVYSIGSSYSYRVLEIKDLGLDATFGAAISMPRNFGNFESRANTAIHVKISSSKNVSKNIDLEAGLRADRKNQNTTIVDQSQSDFGIFLNIVLPFKNAE